MQASLAAEQAITAKIPYLRRDLERLRVDFTARNLGEDLLDRRAETVRNGRIGRGGPSLDREGFELIQHLCPVVDDRWDQLLSDYDAVNGSPMRLAYMDETIPVIRELSGARDVFSADSSTIRYSAVLQNKNAMTPAMWAHFDFDSGETERQLNDILPTIGFEPEPYSRFVLYQAWRSLSPPPQDFPLAMCDGRTVKPGDMVPIEYHMKTPERDVIYQSSGARFSPRHDWWYFPDMTPQELLVFIGFDSALGDDFKTLHVAIADETQARPVPRISLETRYFALFE